MKTLAFFLTVFSLVFVSSLAYAEDTTIEMLNKRDDGAKMVYSEDITRIDVCLLYTSPSPRDGLLSRMPSSA